MALFAYTARDSQGIETTGRLEAANEDEVLSVLQTRGLVVTSLTRQESWAAQATSQRVARRLHGRVTLDDRVLVCEQLAILLDAGVPLLRTLEVICAQVESRSLLNALNQVRREIESGSSFRDALAKHPRIFTDLWLNVVETGEASGHLPQSLSHLARYLDSVRNIQRKAATALTYPVALIVAAVGATTIFLVKIIPIFAMLFESVNAPLPLLTRLVMALSDLLRERFVLLALGGAVVVVVAVQFFKTDAGRWFLDRLLLRIPLFDRLFVYLQITQFAQGLSAMLDSGVPILYSLEIMERSAGNRVYARAIGEIKESVRTGHLMADPMGATGLFPPMVVQMVLVGEEIGKLGEMLTRVAQYYEMKVNTFIERLTALFEPFAIMVMAVVIGTLVIAMYLPIFQSVGVIG